MNPALSVLFLTTLIGAGQGLLLALVAVELVAGATGLQPLLIAGSALSVLLTGLGLVASFFHLGHPERAWRAMAMWRTSWLSREVIVLPAFLGAAALYGLAHYTGSGATPAIGVAAGALALLLFVCTGMIYAAVRAIREWASPLTVLNYTLLGCASGTTLAVALAAWLAPALAPRLALAPARRRARRPAWCPMRSRAACS
jgi:DMSO reductase anchor subunit